MPDDAPSSTPIATNWVPTFPQPATTSLEYSNGVQIAISQWDIMLMFLRTLPAAPLNVNASGQVDLSSSEVRQELVAGVVLTPQHAKALVKALQSNVDQYEAQHGAIPEISLPASQEGQTTADDGKDAADTDTKESPPKGG